MSERWAAKCVWSTWEDLDLSWKNQFIRTADAPSTSALILYLNFCTFSWTLDFDFVLNRNVSFVFQEIRARGRTWLMCPFPLSKWINVVAHTGGSLVPVDLVLFHNNATSTCSEDTRAVRLNQRLEFTYFWLNLNSVQTAEKDKEQLILYWQQTGGCESFSNPRSLFLCACQEMIDWTVTQV